MTKITRRDFIKLAGISAAAASLSGCVGRPFLNTQTQSNDTETPSIAQASWAPTVCRICPAGCGVLARIIGGRAVKIEGNPLHPLNQGKVCPKAQAALQVLYDPDRLQYPHRRVGKRGEGQWERVSWEEAIAQITDHLKELQRRRQAHTLLFLHDAPPGQMRELINRFCQAYGSPNAISGDGWDAERMTHLLTQGWSDLAAHNWEETSYVLFFGGSFLEDWQPQTHMLRANAYMRRGRPDRRARLVQIGPRFSVSAAKADEWIPILPGRQGVLALGMAHVIIRERIYDHAFVADHTEDFDDFAALVLEHYTPETVAGLSGIPADTIRRLARELAGNRPSVAVAGRGLEEGPNALFTHIAIHALSALVGSIDVPGGVLRPRQPPFTPWEPVPEEPSQPRLSGSGLSERLIDGSNPYMPQVLFLYETNPLFEGVGPDLWRGAFQVIPFIVSFSSFMDESTLHADLVLPNHTFLERWIDGMPPGGMGAPMLALGQPTVQPLYDTRHTGDVLLSLAQAIGGPVAELLSWPDYKALLRFRAQGLFETRGSIRADSFSQFWDELVERGVWTGAPYTFGQWEEVLTTPSGRFRFQLHRLKEIAGEYRVSTEVSQPSYAGDESEYPLHLIPYKVIAYTGCRAPNAPLLWETYGLHIKKAWHGWAELNPETAHKLGVNDGDHVWVESPQGRILTEAHLYEGVMPDAVNIPLGTGHTAGGRWASRVEGGNVTELVVPQTDPLAGSVAWCSTRARIYKVET